MKKNFAVLMLTAAVVLTANPAFAQIEEGGLGTFTQDIFDFMIDNVGLMIVGLGMIGALIGAMISNPGEGIGRAIVCAAIGSFIGAIPAIAQYTVGLA